MAGVEMLPVELQPIANDLGLALVTSAAHDLERGFNDPSAHRELQARVSAAIDDAHRQGIAELIVFAGTRGSLDDADAAAACADGIGPLVRLAADAGVGMLIETLNSTVDHPGHQCDRTAFAADVVDRVGQGLRILYDVYHMQIMEGNLIPTLRAHMDVIGHVHTAGNPGRRELDDRQEVNWVAVASHLRDLGYTGWIGHEFVARGDPIEALRSAHRLFA